ncbi:YicC/YloC family endoribonuclease [Caproiciproducens galactitolivorans]|uniref:YicC family protein n=1 Tax=Caproiciproducens galactitolivorans TaxID=642589 RepID=A0ABT4BTU5_9FIRM|nr:YicC/YloC family endoribonuclease [Caproiciproducens galactitolivorans]MCY1714305.1 YicC family protein [Caproiciproducens galactitolivorans]
MIRSMTGFGRCEKMMNGRNIIVEIKSVNHRYFEFSSRITRGYGFLDDKLKSYLQSKISRGKIDVFVSVETMEDVDAQVLVNHSLAAGYVNALRELSQRYNLREDISVGTVSRYTDIFTVHKAPEDEAVIWNSVQAVTDEALQAFLAMREAEGARLKDDVLQRAQTILEIVGKIEERSPQTVSEYQQKLSQKMQEMLGDSNIDEQRILTEAAIFADKVAVSEETVRLRSHFDQFANMLNSNEAIGRKLDFIVQEMNREANTIGSKCVDSQIAYMVVDIKAEIEKIREQIQNIE